MVWEVEKAKNDINTLKCQGQYIYSKYNPIDDAVRFITQNFDEEASEYLLIGLGLGYHLEALMRLSGKKRINVLLVDNQELILFRTYSNNHGIINDKYVNLIEVGMKSVDFDPNIQVLIPFSMMNMLPNEHPIKPLLENIKLKQMSFNLNKNRLAINFEKNLELKDEHWGNYKELFKNDSACLISSGPSIDEILPYLEKIKEKCFILCVGSALRILLKEGITPHAVIISDAKEAVQHQFTGLNYKGPLFYLATASHEVVENYKGKRICLFQKGYPMAEQKAIELGVETIEVGGSVATVGFSLLEYLGFENVILCGQDLGFSNEKTHSTSTTSGVFIKQPFLYKKVMANNGKQINITKSLNVYLQWFEMKARTTKVNMINTALNGTKINGVPYMDPNKMIDRFEALPVKDFSEIYEV